MSATFGRTPYGVTAGGKRYSIGLPGATEGRYDEAEINKLGQTEEERRRKVLEEQKGIQSKRLNDLAALLAAQQSATFNKDIPGIANTAQGQGFLETSGFGGMLADRYKDLTQSTSFELAKQGLTDRDFEVASLGDISNGRGDMNTSALSRRFSVEDNARAEALARELGRMGVSAPAKGPSGFDTALNAAGPILSGVGAVKGA